MAAGNIGGALYLGNNGRVRATGRCVNYLPRKAAADNAVDDHRFVETNLAPGVMNSHPPADPRAGWRAVHLPVGKNAAIAAVVRRHVR